MVVELHGGIRVVLQQLADFALFLCQFGSFNAYIWAFVGGKPRQNRWKAMADIPATSPESDALSKDLKKRGLKFVGSTIMYAHMQAAGLVNDHLISCFRYRECAALGRA